MWYLSPIVLLIYLAGHWPWLPFSLPWWTVYIAWTLVISVSLVSSYFVMLYGLKYGYQKSVDWLVSFFTAFFQSALVTQPLKVIAISLVFTMILKRPVLVQGGKASTGKGNVYYRSSFLGSLVCSLGLFQSVWNRFLLSLSLGPLSWGALK